MSQLNPPMTDHYAESAAERDKRRAKSVRWLISAVDRTAVPVDGDSARDDDLVILTCG